MFSSSQINISALWASYKAALWVVKIKKSYTVAMTLVKAWIKDVLGNIGWIYGKEGSWKITADTIAQCNPELANNRENQFIEQIKLTKYFSLQVDKCIDVANLTFFFSICGIWTWWLLGGK